jgi:hypothetical protein
VLFYLLVWACVLQPVFAGEEDEAQGELLPIRPEDVDPWLFVKRDANDFSVLDPRSSDTIFYGNPSARMYPCEEGLFLWPASPDFYAWQMQRNSHTSM